MQLRAKLLFYYVSLIIITLLVFGISAYRIAYTSTQEKEKALLESMTHLHARLIADEYGKNGAFEHILQHMEKTASADHVWMLIDEEYSVVYPEQITPIFSGDMLRFPLKKLLKGQETNGILSIGDHDYLWALVPLGNLNYKLLHVYRSSYSVLGKFASLASRLTITAVIIIWVAVWIALLIATAITRKIVAQKQELEYQATHDVVTGLPNMVYLGRKIERAMRKGASDFIAIIIVDMDRFREINNTLGHNVGDELLKKLGDKLTSEFWSGDAIARIGGDEFAMMLPMTARSDADTVVKKLQEVMSKPLEIGDMHLEINVSMGVAIYPDDGEDISTLVKHAEVAMFNAKDTGAICEYYDADKDPHSVDKLMLIGEMLHAVENNELLLYYQPKIDIDSNSMSGVEVLLRWMNPARGMIPPGTFIGLAEQGSYIKDITCWVLENAIRQCSVWRKSGLALTVSVNLSVRLLIDAEIVGKVRYFLDMHGVDPGQLVLEITETAIMLDPLRAAEAINDLSEMGVGLSIDDFGTGYTSISQLRTLPVDEVKIDKSFVIDMVKNRSDAEIAQSIIDLAHNMGHRVVAEGVETEQILQELKQRGCDVAQGFYFGKPMPARELESQIEKGRWRVAGKDG